MNSPQSTPPKYDNALIEKKWREYWTQEHIFKFSFDSTKPLYVVDTPPPYVSADHLHAGHIMSYAQAEFIVRFKRMQGHCVYYPMGFDDNGLPTERFVEKKYNLDKSKISKSDFIKYCLKETETGAQTYKQLWDRLGISVDWSKTYSTITPLATKVSQWSMIDLYKKGALYRSENPILWCTSCQTALAQADLEDQEMNSKMNFITFLLPNSTPVTIATTRPELLPACVALYVNPHDARYQSFVGQEVEVPLFKYLVPIKTSEEVNPDFGTGMMMVCTWGDQEDLEKWRHDKLQSRPLFTETGKLNQLGGKYEDLGILEAREEILKDLSEAKLLIKQEDITHTVNVHERCNTPVEFVLSKQWFIKVADLKDTWLQYGRELNWYPENRRQDYELWVNSLKWDWCISRQRYYGVPLPIWYCSSCSEPVFANETDLPVNPLEDTCPATACAACGNTDFTPEADVMDTWATSSVTPLIIKELAGGDGTSNENLFPATLRPNAFEIIRTWDFYSIVKSHYHFGKLPFKDVMISGHGMDEQGKKFSKRLGNFIPSDVLLETYGADAIRYWATGAQLGQNLRFNTQEVEKGKKTAIKLWNVARFLNMNLSDFNKNQSSAIYEHADIWVITELNQTIAKATQAFEEYAYPKAKDYIDDFFWSKFTDNYLEFIKYRLSEDDGDSKFAAQTTVYSIFLAILKLYAPILPFITEELYQGLYKDYCGDKSIHISVWPKVSQPDNSLDISDFGTALDAITEIRKAKSEQGLSLGKVLPEYTLKTPVDIEKYGHFIQKVMRVESLNT